MSLYRAFIAVEIPPEIHKAIDSKTAPLRAALGAGRVSAREVLARHPWAAPLMESRTEPGPETLGHHDAVLGFVQQELFDLGSELATPRNVVDGPG